MSDIFYYQTELFESIQNEHHRLKLVEQENERKRLEELERQQKIILDPELQQQVFNDINAPQNVVKNPGCGDCLFWTLIHAMIHSGLKMDSYLDSPQRVRNEIALWFLQIYHSDRFLKTRFVNVQNLEKFNKLLVQNGVWTKLDNNKFGFDLIFYVVSKILNTNIVVCNYCNKQKKWNGIVFRGKTNEHRFFVQLKNEHFQLIEGNDFINSIDLCNFEKLD